MLLVWEFSKKKGRVVQGRVLLNTYLFVAHFGIDKFGAAADGGVEELRRISS